MTAPGGSPRRRRIGKILAVLAVIAFALAVWAQLTEGFRVHVVGIPISIRGELRPALIGLVLMLASLHLLNAWHSPALTAAVRSTPRLAPWAAALISAWVLAVGLSYGSRVAGGSDASGYASQAELWLNGRLKVPQPDVGPVPWPDPHWTFAPLGYRPGPDPAYLVPTYAPGLALLMAGATLIAGACGPYLISPLCACLLIWTTYAIGRRLSGPAVGLIAATVLAASPTFQFMTLQPMSDVPNAAFWTLSLFFGGRSPLRRDAFFAGLAAGVAVVIRPNLAVLVAVPALLTLWTSQPRVLRVVFERAVLFGAGCAPFAVLIGIVFNHLYGSPLMSGYGSLADTYSMENAPLTLARYPRWFLDSQGPLAFAFLLTFGTAFAAGVKGRTERLLFLAFIFAVTLCYVFYTAFEEWWYLRFLLPAFPFAFILSVDAVAILAGRFGRIARGVALTVTAVALIASGATESASRDVIGSGDGERRYADAAHHVQTQLPTRAIVMTMQHSGSINHYTDKLTMRYDSIGPEWVDQAIELFERQGRPVYVLLDDWEIPLFADKFRGRKAGAIVSAKPLAVTPDGRVQLFAADSTASSAAQPTVMRRTTGCLTVVGNR